MSDALPWSVTVRFMDLTRGPLKRRLDAEPSALEAIARHLGLVGVESLTADILAKPWLDGAEIDGRFRARVTYTCGVTAEPFDDDVTGDFLVRVLPAGSPNAPQEEVGEEIDLDPDADDPPDVLESDAVDLGAYVVEHLSLELDPFPRKPGATFQPPEPEESLSPFAALRALRKDDAPE